MKRFKRILTSSFAALALLAAPAAFAGTEIDGDVEIDVETGDVISLALGGDAMASTSIGTVHDGSEVDGDVEIDVETGDVVTLSLGRRSLACTAIGSVGAETCR